MVNDFVRFAINILLNLLTIVIIIYDRIGSICLGKSVSPSVEINELLVDEEL